MIKIEKGVPPPLAEGRKRLTYPWSKMEVGDSFFVAGKKRHDLVSAMKLATRKLQAGFVSAQVEGGVRVWRVE